MASHIKDSNLWESGELKLSWVRSHMPLLDGIQKDFEAEKPFKGLKVALSVHLEDDVLITPDDVEAVMK